MKIAIMQPYLFPYLGYFQLLNSVDKFIIHDDVQWIKGGWINRNRILLNDHAEMLTLSVKKRSNFDKINEYEIFPEPKNKIKFVNKVKAAYSKSPYFNEVFSLINEIFAYEEMNLVKFIKFSIEQIKKYIMIKTPMIFSSEMMKNNALTSQDRVIEICRLSGADTYINPVGGVSLYDKTIFKHNNIKLLFLKTKTIKYRQFANDFVSDLSLIDVLMFNSKNEIYNYLTNYDLV